MKPKMYNLENETTPYNSRQNGRRQGNMTTRSPKNNIKFDSKR